MVVLLPLISPQGAQTQTLTFRHTVPGLLPLARTFAFGWYYWIDGHPLRSILDHQIYAFSSYNNSAHRHARTLNRLWIRSLGWEDPSDIMLFAWNSLWAKLCPAKVKTRTAAATRPLRRASTHPREGAEACTLLLRDQRGAKRLRPWRGGATRWLERGRSRVRVRMGAMLFCSKFSISTVIFVTQKLFYKLFASSLERKPLLL